MRFLTITARTLWKQNSSLIGGVFGPQDATDILLCLANLGRVTSSLCREQVRIPRRLMALPPTAARPPLLEADAAARASEGRTAREEARHPTQDKLVVGIAAAVNPLNRAFGPRPLSDNIDGHLRLAHALVAGRRQQQISAPVRALCNFIEARLKNIKEAHRLGAATVDFAA